MLSWAQTEQISSTRCKYKGNRHTKQDFNTLRPPGKCIYFHTEYERGARFLPLTRDSYMSPFICGTGACAAYKWPTEYELTK